jgi:hypothetical protein
MKKKLKPPKTFKNLPELLQGDTPYRFARGIYKSTACGPWMMFIMRGRGAYTLHHMAICRVRNDMWQLVGHTSISDDLVRFMGFDKETGLSRKERKCEAYLEAIRNYEAKPDPKYRITHHVDGKGSRRMLTISCEERIPEEEISVYYEKVPLDFDPARCIAIEIGSIVEGSEVEIPPARLTFPFHESEFYDTLDAIDREADFYWKRDNTTNYTLLFQGTPVGLVSWTAFDGEPKWVSRLVGKTDFVTDSVKKAWIKWYTQGRWKNGTAECPTGPIKFGPKDWTCQEWFDDSTF